MEEELRALLSRTALGDRDAFKALYQATSPQILGLLIHMLGQRDRAEDALQDTYIKVWHRARDYHAERGQVNTWLASIARYRALDLLRADKTRQQRASRAKPELATEDELPDALAQSQSDNGRLYDCLHQLNDRQRQSIGLAFFRGFTHEELAAQLAAPLGTVKAWIRRGLQQLRLCLEE